MSFTTRSGRTAGRGQQQTQVTYHQTPRQQPPGQAGYQQPFQQQMYPGTQPAPPGATSPLPTPQQAQQQQQFKTQMKMETATPTKAGLPQAPATPSSGIIMHQSPVPTQAQPQAQPQVQSQAVIQAPPQLVGAKDDGSEASDKPWKKFKNPSFKVNKVLKRRRQNARFRKLLIPKNAIMVLNELQPGIAFEAEEQTNALSQMTYTVKINIDGVTYNGEGSSKTAAKAAAAELAVKGLILKKITESTTKREVEEDTSMETGSGDDTSEKGSVNGRRVIPEDEVPWGSLASFALFKLFADWKAQGTNIPTVMTPPPAKTSPKPAAPKPTPTPTTGVVPAQPETLHPVTLVGRLYPGTLISELSREGNPPFLVFRMGATVNGVLFTGEAKSKKEAKKNCAIAILNSANVPFNTNL